MATRWASVGIVVTPGSGEGRARGVARRLARRLRRRGSRVTVKTFGDLASLAAWARSAGPEFSVIYCVGGDATQSAAAALARRHRIPFVPIPSGFGNLFASVFGHRDSPRAAARLLAEGEIRLVDVGLAGDELFLSHKSYGFIDRIQQRVEQDRRQPRGRARRLLAYYGTAVRAAWTTPLSPLSVAVDGALVAEDAVLVTVANVETYRDFLPLTPAASPIDGRFDVFVIPRTGKLGLAWRLFRLKLRLPGRWKGVSLFRGRTVVVGQDGRRETLRVVRRALPLLLPPGSVAALERRQVEVEDEAPVEAVASSSARLPSQPIATSTSSPIPTHTS
ncbi:MAG TPA: diacylglycerol kinase family protein [Methylomirabilota bacterium]|nr:diacylglycerol kinase family protein [Methylomirabilota bacterium]